MATKLTKGLLQGQDYTRTITVYLNEEPYEIDVQPLNGPQSTEVEEAMQEGNDIKGKPGRNGKMEQQMSIDLKKNTQGRKRADILACAYGIADSEMDEQFIKKEFPNQLIVQVAEEVKTMSGIQNKKEAERFRTGEGSDSTGERNLVPVDEEGGDQSERIDPDESVST